MDLCIIADDLTGAFDAAAPFAGRGLPTVVALRPEALPEALAKGARIVAVSTQSREIPAEAAQAAVAAVARLLPEGARVFKKVDSRLKGHIAEELAALAPERLLVAPAIPDFGRIVSGGAVCGFGVEVPIPVAPVLGSFAAHAVIPDTATPEEMRAALALQPEEALLVGARGLAEALAVELSGQVSAVAPVPQGSRALIVIGSRDPITLAQVAQLQARGVDWRGAPNGRLTDLSPPKALTVVQAVPGDRVAAGAEVSAALAQSLHPALTDAADLLFLTGGATAEAVMDAMALSVLELRGEVLPGVPLAMAGERVIIVKSGGFGGQDTLIRLAGMLDGTG